MTMFGGKFSLQQLQIFDRTTPSVRVVPATNRHDQVKDNLFQNIQVQVSLG